ncbi:MAG: 4Fe-4S binding protein [Eubacteriales bacterium]|nr:4Fe-4S binding protein [Eubacteriales bacterium]
MELADIVGDNGFQVVAGCTVVTEHNILTQFARGRPSSKDKKEIQEFALLSSKKILENDSTRPFIPGSFPYKQWDGVRLNIRINYDTCINCGLCFEKCPVNAIFEKSWQCDMEKCILCMRCIKICPNQSRYLEPNAIARMTEDMRKFCESRKENEYYL